MSELTIRPVHGIGEVRPGDDLAALIAAAAPWLVDGDVLVVTSKVVSKAEGRLAPVPPVDGPERDAARAGVLAAETARVVAARGPTRIVQTHQGLVLAAGGIDTSNVDRGHVVLLPADPDASARRLRAELRDRYGLAVAVIISDTMGRPWRLGLTDVAIGAAGIGALRDHRGEADAHGNELSLTQVAVIDELAGAAELVKGKADQVPVAVVRGYRHGGAGDGAGTLVRPADQDLFSMGTAEARADGLRAAATLPDAAGFGAGPVDHDAVERALAVVALPGPELTVSRLDEAQLRTLRGVVPASTRAVLVPGVGSLGPVRAGAAVHRLRAALAAEGLSTAWLELDPGGLDAPLGLVAVGLPADPDAAS